MTEEAPRMAVRYGRVNKELIGSWLRMDAENDGPFWALNLMKYRPVADYGDGPGDQPKSGREADDEYTPRGALAAIGAEIVFAADVTRTIAGDGMRWDRVGIVRYPSRKLFLEMQQREDFKRQHVHKDAGMEFTIVMSCLPRGPFPDVSERAELVEMRVDASAAEPSDAARTFDVEGVIVGDERTWTRASFRWLHDEAAPLAGASDDRSTYVLILRPIIDRLAACVHDLHGAD